MREVRNYRHYFAVGNGEYEDTSIWNDLRYCEPREDECFELNTFAEAVEAIKRGAIHREYKNQVKSKGFAFLLHICYNARGFSKRRKQHGKES